MLGEPSDGAPQMEVSFQAKGLNRVAAVYEYEVDAEGNASAVTWEWS